MWRAALSLFLQHGDLTIEMYRAAGSLHTRAIVGDDRTYFIEDWHSGIRSDGGDADPPAGKDRAQPEDHDR